MLCNLSVILVRTRFPENIGMVARAMSNMGASELILVRPERWDYEKAVPLATAQGVCILDSLLVVDSLEEALKPFSLAIGATARTGGDRRETLSPEQAALACRAKVREGAKAALVLGSEDKGLTNEEVELCTDLVTIPTAVEHSSLNLAQAALILLYECLKADMALPFCTFEGQTKRQWAKGISGAGSRRITLEEEAHLFSTLQDTLEAIDHLPKDNPGWLMQPMRRLLRKSRLRRNEFDMLMGLFRQIRGKLGRS